MNSETVGRDSYRLFNGRVAAGPVSPGLIKAVVEVVMLIDCDTCVARDVGCSDCVIALLMRAPDASLDLDESEAEAFGALAAGGLTPPLRLVPVLRGWPRPA